MDEYEKLKLKMGRKVKRVSAKRRLVLDLIIFRQQNASGTAVSLGDDPEFDAVVAGVSRQQAKALFQSDFVFRFVFLVEVAPVALDVPIQRGQDFVGRQLSERVRRDDDLPQWKFEL